MERLIYPSRAPISRSCAVTTVTLANQVAAPNGGYRVPPTRRAVTVGNEVPPAGLASKVRLAGRAPQSSYEIRSRASATIFRVSSGGACRFPLCGGHASHRDGELTRLLPKGRCCATNRAQRAQRAHGAQNCRSGYVALMAVRAKTGLHPRT
jgi:hypothetical protein